MGSSPEKQAPPDPVELEAEAEACRASLAEFIRRSWHVLEPATPLNWNWHIDAIALHVQAVLEDWLKRQEDPEYKQRIQNLLINVPPGTGKSRIVSVCAPAWMWTRCPTWRAIFLSANPRVALRDSLYCRDVIESSWYQQVFRPTWKLDQDQNAKGLFRNTVGGERQAIGFNSRITGARGDALFVDDPHDAEEVQSDALRTAVTERWDSAIANRVNDLRCSVRIGIMQRLHEADWSGHVLAQGGWEHLCLPMEFEPERLGAAKDGIPSVTAIGWRDPRTKAGELLFEERFPREILALERTRLGSSGYAGQHQQRPAPADGNLFKKAWFANRYRTLPKMRAVASFWDTALKEKEQNDESACVVAGLGEDGDLYILRVTHGRWETPDLAKFLVDQAAWLKRTYGETYRGDYVEDKVSGTTLMQYVRRSNPDIVIIPISVDLDKVARAQGSLPLCEAGRVHFPDPNFYPAAATWAGDTIDQLAAFPFATLKDIVDAFVYSCKWLMGTLNQKKSRRRGGGFV